MNGERTMKQVYENIKYGNRIQNFTYFGTQEGFFPNEELHLYNGEPNAANEVHTLSHKTLDNLLKLQDYDKMCLDKTW